MNPENAIASVIIGIVTFYMIYSLSDISFSSGSVSGVNINLILGIVLGFIIAIVIYASISEKK